MKSRKIFIGVLMVIAMAFSGVLLAQQSSLKAPHAKSNYPKITLYSVSWCPHCMKAKQYMTINKIPFINRDVEIDADAMETLKEKYNSDGVPVIVVGEGNNEHVVKGFTVAQLNEAIAKARAGQR